jgi:hypothetical protein
MLHEMQHRSPKQLIPGKNVVHNATWGECDG